MLPSKPKLAFLGTGLMGRPMSANLLKAGYEVTVFNRSPENPAALAEQGATVASTAAEAVQNADVVITMLPNGPVVSQVLLDGVFAAARRETLFVDMSSIHPAIARDLAAAAQAHELRFVDAPVSGGTGGAERGELAIMAGGPEDWIEELRPVLDVLGRVTHVGPAGSGQLAKLVNQVIVAVTIGAVAEGLTLARAGGADPARVREAILGGFAQSRILTEHGRRMIERDFAPGGTVTTQIKDLDAALDVAANLGAAMPLTARARELFADYAAAGGGEGARDDHSALVKHIEALGNLTVEA
ncbi:NAD(P)-dependent oxidoreductase [Deinococcus arenicola]|uniref:NAD(P)-dependent oxidoreductase n=1 Tax=Deinococcus arenicola TaxID=2994950 RepID=A0ABU4DRV0_9DEIO|nr:NAD(P)-dependent oxidoreductase [Deinococcus sp. ZS9-10]MDV6374600.1 NAD(P)-dependent oxidoreductase [Deinococcus sp. ZS9-10]